MNEEKKFILVFAFCCGIVLFGVSYIYCLTFFVIPPANIRFADTSIGWIEGTLITAAVFYLLGGNPTAKKPDATVLQTGDSPVNNVTPSIVDAPATS
ncbi:MAG: hypothetical protein ACHQF4_02420 [Sphingobacteriales bacterium]|jgi:hypothetical protein